jgi:CBS domain-containing protein
MKVSQMMTERVLTIAPSDTVALADDVMNGERIRHLPVVDGDTLVGLLSQRDVLAASISSVSRPSEDDDRELKRRLKVSEIMRGFVETVRPDDDVVAAAEKLLEAKVGCLPVIDERFHIVGIVTESDFVRLARALLLRGARAGRAPAG